MFEFLKQFKKDRPMRIVVNGHPALRAISAPVTEISKDEMQLADELKRSLEESEIQGVGLAAPQIGVNKRMIVIKTTGDDGRSRPGALPGELILDPLMPVVLVNPEIVASSEETSTVEEGCLSLPGVNGHVTRPVSVTLHATLMDGQELTAECGGLLARCLQHEIDHLDGKLFFDKIPADEQKAAMPQMKKLSKREAGLRRIQPKHQ
ncbi:MAG: peptide deformylase [Lentisphaeria bacterium]|nr:peptide deformylase [Lentisphaeria bacterium]